VHDPPTSNPLNLPFSVLGMCVFVVLAVDCAIDGARLLTILPITGVSARPMGSD